MKKFEEMNRKFRNITSSEKRKFNVVEIMEGIFLRLLSYLTFSVLLLYK